MGQPFFKWIEIYYTYLIQTLNLLSKPNSNSSEIAQKALLMRNFSIYIIYPFYLTTNELFSVRLLIVVSSWKNAMNDVRIKHIDPKPRANKYFIYLHWTISLSSRFTNRNQLHVFFPLERGQTLNERHYILTNGLIKLMYLKNIRTCSGN